MDAAIHPMIRRRDAAQAALDTYRGQPFTWGRFDCARLAAFVLRALGHKPGLSRGGAYSTALGARKALKRAGFDSLEAGLDALGLPRIPPAAALPGDLLALQADSDGWAALSVALGNGRVLGFYGDPPVAHVLHPNFYAAGACVGAWRVEPKGKG